MRATSMKTCFQGRSEHASVKSSMKQPGERETASMIRSATVCSCVIGSSFATSPVSIVSILDLPSDWCLTKQLGVARIGLACIRLRRLGPAETAEAENKKDREYRENEDNDENVDGLQELKHEEPPREAALSSYRCSSLNRYIV